MVVENRNLIVFFFFQAEDGIRYLTVTGVQTCALPISKEVTLELVPQGILCERMRAAGAGLQGFYTTVGVGTEVAEGKEERFLEGQRCILEMPIHADYALVKAHKADELGNLTYRLAARNFNPIMAMAAKTTIAEVEELVSVGSIEPEHVMTPAIFVHRIVQAKGLHYAG